MENENIYTALIYLQYHHKNITNAKHHPLEYYKIGDKINFRLRSKTEVTKILENPQNKENLLYACQDLSTVFIQKVKSIVEDKPEDDIDVLNKNIEIIFNVSSTGRRTQQSFYALWYFITEISLESIKQNKIEIRQDLHDLFQSMNLIESKELFAKKIIKFWDKFKN